MARWRIKEKAFLDLGKGIPQIVRPGEFEYAGWPSLTMYPVDDDARRIEQFYINWKRAGSDPDSLPPTPTGIPADWQPAPGAKPRQRPHGFRTHAIVDEHR